MRIFQNHDNGNLAAGNINEVASHRNTDNRSWLYLNNTTQTGNVYTTFGNQNKNCNNVLNLRSNTDGDDTSIRTVLNSEETHVSDAILVSGVCNKQYRINSANKLAITCTNSEPEKLSGNELENNVIHRDSSPDCTPLDEERIFQLSGIDEMSENILHPVPRGIVNPNYPGFQHLAHTLQEYSTNIEIFYHSENEMTDDDLEADIVDQRNSNQSKVNVNNNNITSTENHKTEINAFSQKESTKDLKSDIPDLLKTLSNNNNNIDIANYDCSDTDIENNFHAKDIIGNFNKEIEDEIKQLLNYNINIQDDLEELRKDIKDTFAKPIENTINNISDVVNHVIKKLVETHNDSGESAEHNPKSVKLNGQETEELNNINRDNETNTRTEMNLSRPTFLLIDNHPNNDIKDALLSDGKDEINFYENDYDTEVLSHNVENTIKQLSTELRKIIPKLNEMRDRDRFWAENVKDRPSVLIDRNSNKINNTLNGTNLVKKSNALYKTDNKKENKWEYNRSNKLNKSSSVLQSVQSTCKDRHLVPAPEINPTNVQNAVSITRNDSSKDTDFGTFDVYNIETALPEIDLDAIENHLKAAKEAERRKRNDREEIRKRLAMDADEEYYSLGHTDRPGKKPSLHSRLQNGKNLQICFMNETASDNESQTSDIEKNLNFTSKSISRTSIFGKGSHNHPYQTRPLSVNVSKNDKISTAQCGTKLRSSPLIIKTLKSHSTQSLNHIDIKETNFCTLQARLQTEARIALAQAKEMAHIQMERERCNRSVSPVTEMLRHSMEKANAPLTPDRRRVSRQLLTDMNIAQLQVIVNELHSQIESLNDTLVKLLMARDELHMGQDSMLVDIEDLTRYLGVKEQTKKTKGTTKSGVRRLASLVHK